ncbi:MAG TPA: thiamine pyrophosphate-dependent dehydrogenase E1 component subunit alpha [bacterium]|nr:thiamine pyrophosphate-dependent dehydrogenase E1 component subunit alpha [bacterium]
MNTNAITREKLSAAPAAIPVEDQKRLYYFLIKTRIFDERCRRLFKQGRFPGTYFSAVGQEAAGVGSAYGLRPEDIIAPSHRELGAYVTKGIPLVHFLKQIFARANSSDKGKSHPCHYGSTEHGLYTPASTMAGQLPVGAGMALAFKIRREPRVVMAYIGEGGTSRGAFHEALNFAGVHDLPIVFVCMNNLWAESVPASLQSRLERYSDRAKAYGFPGVTIDGNDLLLVYTTVKAAIDKARSGGGPTLIECQTYRWYGHSEIDPANYRDAKEVEEWKRRDPVALYERYLEANGIMGSKERLRIQQEIEAELEAAIAEAEAAPHPRAEEAYDDVYSFSPRTNFPG